MRNKGRRNDEVFLERTAQIKVLSRKEATERKRRPKRREDVEEILREVKRKGREREREVRVDEDYTHCRPPPLRVPMGDILSRSLPSRRLR